MLGIRIGLYALLLVSVGLAPFVARGEEGWRLRLIDDKGIDDPQNVGADRMTVHGDYLFLGTWNTQRGASVYRSKDGESWERISEPSIKGDVDDFCVVGFVWYGDYLYAGTWNQKDGAAMFRAKADAANAADIAWETIGTGGFGNPRNWGFTHMREFKGHLYAGCFNFVEGSEVWRSATGDPGTWTMVIPKAWGSKVNTDSTMMLVHDGYLYLGTESARDTEWAEGTQLYRTDGNLAPPYDQWQRVNPNGFGNGHNHNICGLAELDGKIYAGTWNQTQGVEVWRATPSAEVPFPGWEKVASGGFSNKANIFTTCMTTFNGAVYVGTIGQFETTPRLFILPNAKLVSAHGGELHRSTDGTTWEEIDAPGFMDAPDIGVQWFAEFNGKLYIGSQAIDRPMQLWVYEPTP